MAPRYVRWALAPWVSNVLHCGRTASYPKSFSGLSAFYGKPESDEERFKVLDKAYELGEKFWDSVDPHNIFSYDKR